MADGVLRVAVTCEDEAHFALATGLADRVLLQEAAAASLDYLDRESLHYYRRYSGRTDEERYYPVKHAVRDATEGVRSTIGGRRIRLQGHIKGKPLEPEAQMWRSVFVLFATATPSPVAVIVVRDTDGDDGWVVRATDEDGHRPSGLTQALQFMKSELPDSFPVIVATPHPEAEAWFVAGFVATSDEERKRLRDLTGELSFNPTTAAHLLTAHPNQAKTDAKRVLRALLFDENKSKSPSQEELPEVCERVLGDLELLEKRGKGCHLKAFIDDLRKDLVPALLPAAAAIHRR